MGGVISCNLENQSLALGKRNGFAWCSCALVYDLGQAEGRRLHTGSNPFKAPLGGEGGQWAEGQAGACILPFFL